MKFRFPKQDGKAIVKAIEEALGGRSLADMVKFDSNPSSLIVTISKIGTSTLTFARAEAGNEVEYTLKEEKIAFTHKAFKDEVTKKLLSVIEKAGGKLV
jgi:hypothetical protein